MSRLLTALPGFRPGTPKRNVVVALGPGLLARSPLTLAGGSAGSGVDRG
jgi:hypothetical protein